MTRFTLPTEFRPGSGKKGSDKKGSGNKGWDKRVQRFVGLARAILAFERVWPALWPAIGIAGLVLTAGLFGAFIPLAWPLHALILACLTTGLALSFYFNLEHFVFPRWEDGARRLEQDSSLVHRPISEADDELAAGAGDAWAEELWRAHLKARLAGLARLKLKLPKSSLPREDPRGLRFGVVILVVIGFFVAGKDWQSRIESIFTPNPGVLATLDAWIEPPAYTGQPSVYLGREARVSVPAGSVLNLRVHGADHRPSTTLDEVEFQGGKGEYAGSAKLMETDRIRVRAGGHTIGSWRVTVIPDKPPTIAFAGKPEATERQALKLTYATSDDYGVTAARAIITPHGKPGEPLVFDLQIPERSAKPVVASSFRDLTEHPYAGLLVDITLEARDAAGNKATSQTVTFRLPARVFTDPMARALIEQRQILAMESFAGKSRVAKTLDALTYAPEMFFEGKPSVYLGIRSAYRSTMGAYSREDLTRIEDLLWQIAVSLEQGGLLSMAEQLRRMQAAIMQMMAEGAPQEDIDAMLKRYQEMMQQYLAALARNAPENGAPPDPNAKVMGADDLAALMKAIEALSQSGDRLRAMQLLAMLQSLLENAQVAGGQGQGGQGMGGDPAANQALQGLGELMGKQRALLDKTFRQGSGGGDPKDGGAKGLSQQQGQLKNELDGLKGRLKKSPGQQNFDKAGKLMDEAQKALGMGDIPRATTLQKYVLEELSKGAEAVAKAAGQGQNQAKGKDPLGRNTGNTGRGGSDVKIPDAQVLQRARDILLELRKRAGQQGRSKEELDYIDRLLKQF
ncbi:TIGR02302 family protein [Rhizomicrobium palustre]